MRAITWQGVNHLEVESVPDATLLDPRDALVRVLLSSVCGSDLHLVDGYVLGMEHGDVLGHEFLGEVVEVGRDVREIRVGQRVVACSIIACGSCWQCRQQQYSLCETTNPLPGPQQRLWGQASAGIFGYSHLTGGFAGSHADYVRVPIADVNLVAVPEEVSDEAAVFTSDAVPTGWMGADLADIGPGDTVGVWGAGGVGLMAAHGARAMGAGDVVLVDRVPERLALARVCGFDVLHLEKDDVQAALLERTAGRGPDRCIEAVGMEADGAGLVQQVYDRATQKARIQTERAGALREAILACRKGGMVVMLGVFVGLADKVPLGALMNKGLTLRGAQQHGQRYIPMLLDRVRTGDLDPSLLLTHRLGLHDGPRGYEMFKHKQDGCVRAVFDPRLPSPQPATAGTGGG
jgi:threonine dehydrogenase-like Zn-dependent dehydrogenase